MDSAAPQMADGEKYLKDLSDAGFTPDEVAQEQGHQSDDMMKANFSPQEIRDYWGKKEPDMAGAKAAVQNNLKQAQPASPKAKREPIDVSVKPVEAKDIWDSLAAGWGNSVLGLLTGGGESPIQNPENATMAQTLVSSAAQLAGDAPAMAAGMVAGTAAGAGAGTATLPVVGTISGAAVGGGAGAFAVPAAMRKVLIDHYQKGDIQDAGDFARRVVDTTWEATKGALTGTASVLATPVGGSAAVLAAEKLGGGALTQALSQTGGRLAAEIAAQTTVSSALEGHMPNRNDFLNGAIAIGGLHAVGFGASKVDYIAKKMMNIYGETGAPPAEQIEAANSDAKLKGELLSDNPTVPKEATQPNPDTSLEEQEKTGLKPFDEKDIASQKVKAAGDEILSRVAKEEKVDRGLKDIGMDVKNGLYKWWIDTNDYTRAVGNVMEEQGLGDLPAEENAHKLMNLFPAYIDKVKMAIHQGTLDFKTKLINGEALSHINDDYAKEFPEDPKREELKKYEIARQSLDLDKRGIEKVGYRENDRLFVDANKEKYQKYLDRKVQWENRNLQYVRDSGVISSDQFDRIVDTNPNHVPLNVVQEIDELTGRSKGGNQKILQRISGSDRMLIDPDVSRLKNLDMMIRTAEENHAIREFYKGQMSLPEEERAIRDTVSSTKQIRVSSEEMSEALAKQGINIDPDAISVFRPREKLLLPSQRDFFDNGDRKVFEGAPEVIDALNRMKGDHTSTNVWAQYILRPFTVALRAGTVNNPFFGLRHAEKNQFVGATYSQTGFKPGQGWANLGISGLKEAFDKISEYRDTPEALKSINQISDIVTATHEILKNDPKYQRFEANGGSVNAVVPLDKGYLDGEIYKLTKSTDALSKVWNGMKTVGTFAHSFITLNDNLIRFEEFKGLVDKGLSDQEAAYQARQVLPDYQKAALQKSALHTVKAFLKVHMLSVDRMAQELSDPEKRSGFLLKNLTYNTLPALMLAAANYGNDSLDDVTDHDKAVNFVTQIPSWRPANSLAEAMSVKSAYPSSVRQKDDGSYEVNDGKVWRIPKAFAPGIAFASGPEAILESWKKQDPKAFLNFAGEIAKQIVVSPIPDAPTPVLEQMTNRNFWNNQPLVRQSMEGKLPWEQYDQNTSEVGKFIAKALSYVPGVRDIGPQDAKLSSAAVIDNYLHSFGTLGNYIVDLTDKSLRAAGIAPPDPGRIRDMETMPFLREFMLRNGPGSHPQSVEDFMDRYKTAGQVQTTIKDLMKQGKTDEAIETQNRYAVNMEKLTGVDKAIVNAQKAITNIDLDPTIPAAQKRQNEQLLYYHMVSWAKEGNRLMDQFETSVKNTKGR